MPHIPVQPELPGIVGLFAFRPQTGGPLTALAETLLRGESTLSPGERELIASYVSQLNQTRFCQLSHGAAAAAHLGDRSLLETVWSEGPDAVADARLRALLHLAHAVTQSAQGASTELVQAARDAGADDIAIHDTVLIAAAFCMFNRYVDGLATVAPQEPEAYTEMGCMMAQQGYQRHRPGVPTLTQN